MKYIYLLIMHGYTVEFKPVYSGNTANGIQIHIHKDGSEVLDIFANYMQAKKFVKNFWLNRHTN